MATGSATIRFATCDGAKSETVISMSNPAHFATGTIFNNFAVNNANIIAPFTCADILGKTLYTTGSISACDVVVCPTPTLAATGFAMFPFLSPIPTLGEWGLIALALLMLSAGVLAIRQRKAQEA